MLNDDDSYVMQPGAAALFPAHQSHYLYTKVSEFEREQHVNGERWSSLIHLVIDVVTERIEIRWYSRMLRGSMFLSVDGVLIDEGYTLGEP